MNFVKRLLNTAPGRCSPFLSGRLALKKPLVPVNACRSDLNERTRIPEQIERQKRTDRARKEEQVADEESDGEEDADDEHVDEVCPGEELDGEDQLDDFSTNRFYPVNLGDVYFNIEDLSSATIPNVYSAGYQVLSKFGRGKNSTIWLGRDLKSHAFVALKIFREHAERASGPFKESSLPINSIYRQPGDAGYDVFTEHAISPSQMIGRHWPECKPSEGDETARSKVLKLLKAGDGTHWGKSLVKIPVDEFSLTSDGRHHHCHVHEPLAVNWRHVMRTSGFEEDTLKAGLVHILLALDYLHECKVVHTNIKPDGIFERFGDGDFLEREAFEVLWETPPRDMINGHPVYESTFGREMLYGVGRPGPPVLCDLGLAVQAEPENSRTVQPAVYRAPEVILGAKWSYPIDIWNLGVMIFDLIDETGLFDRLDRKAYDEMDHLAEMIRILGLPSHEFAGRGERSSEFFSFHAKNIVTLNTRDLSINEDITAHFEGDTVPVMRRRVGDKVPYFWKDKDLLVDFLNGMLQWRPEDRLTAKELLLHPWMFPMTKMIGRRTLNVPNRWDLKAFVKKDVVAKCIASGGDGVVPRKSWKSFR